MFGTRPHYTVWSGTLPRSAYVLLATSTNVYTFCDPIMSHCVNPYEAHSLTLSRSTVKRPRSYLPGRVPGQQVERTRRRPPKRRHTISSRPVFRLRGSSDKEVDYREALRKQFQKDIDETVAELMHSIDCQWVGGMEEGGMEEGDLVSRRLDFDFEMASGEQGDERERQWPTNHFGVTPITKCKVCVCVCVCVRLCV